MSTIIDGSSGITTPGLVNSGNETVSGTLTASGFNAASTFGFKNRIINGAMMIDQRNAGASVTPTDGQYTLDRYKFGVSQASKLTTQQSSTAPSGFINSMIVTSSSAYTVLTGDYFYFQQRIEGLNTADLGWGAVGASTVTLSFWVRSSLTGTFGGCVQNSAGSRSYPFSYTISSANTFEYKTITIPGDTTGTWLTTNGIGITVQFGLGVGSTYSGTAGSWAAANYVSATGATSVVGTSGATFYITGVQLEKGSTATSFDYRPYTTELQLCQRYYYQLTGNTAPIGSGYNRTTSIFYAYCALPVAMRATPTLNAPNSAAYFSVEYGTAGSANVSTLTAYIGTTTTYFVTGTPATSITAGSGCVVFTNNSASYLGFNAEL